MINEEIFRAYDIRGIYPSEVNEDFAYILGKSYGSILQEKYGYKACVVSHDNRISSPMLTENLIKGILETGCKVFFLGLTTTPMNYYARNLKNVPGIMVTASHNPKDDNGFKFSFDGMINARGEMITDFLAYTKKCEFLTGNGTIEKIDIKDEYVKFLKETIKYGSKKRKVVIDPGNGVGSILVHDVFDDAYIEPIYINDISDGTFPNHHPDPAVEENLTQLKEAVLENNADYGIAFDGDCDRIGIVDNKGNMLPIEYFMILNIQNIIDKVENKTFLYDIKCSKSVEDSIRKLGGNPLCYRTGASYSEYKVVTDKIPFGCEYSGHAFFTDRTLECGSALYAALRFIELMSFEENDLTYIVKDFPKYFSTPEIKIPTIDSIKFSVVEKVKEFAKEKNYKINDIDGVRITFEDGWVLVRASNTGPNLIFRAESVSEQRVKELEDEYLHLIETYNK